MIKDKYLQLTTVAQVDNAFNYLTEPKKRRKTNDFFCLGRDSKTREFLRQVKMPALPLLADNVSLRKSLEPREKSPLFKVVAGAIALKTNELKEQIALAVQEEKSKELIEILYTLEQPEDGEFIDSNPLTEKEFNALIQP